MSDWTDDAACKDHPYPDLWHPTPNSAGYEAKAVCRGCPVLQACGAAALADPTLTGVWGGLTDAERARMRPRAKAAPKVAACGTRSGYNIHVARKESPCDPCRAANAAYKKSHWLAADNRRRAIS